MVLILDSVIESSVSVRCPELRVTRADYASCNGVYSLHNSSVSWAPDTPVYKHKSKEELGDKNSHFYLLSLLIRTQAYFLQGLYFSFDDE